MLRSARRARLEARTTAIARSLGSSSLGDWAVGLGDQFEQVAVGVVEIDAAAAVEVIDLARPLAAEIRIMCDAGGADAGECRRTPLR
jgi:hypothetical protein